MTGPKYGRGGGLLCQLPQLAPRRSTTNAGVYTIIHTAFLAGLLLVGVLEGMDGVEVNHAKVAVKLVIGLVLLVLVMANLRKEKIPNGLWAGLLVLSVVEVCVAVLWSSAHSVS